MRSAWPSELEGRATFLPRRRYQERKVTPADEAAAFRVLVDYVRRVPGVVARGSLTRKGSGDTVRLTSPPHGLVLRARGKGVSEEGGRE